MAGRLSPGFQLSGSKHVQLELRVTHGLVRFHFRARHVGRIGLTLALGVLGRGWGTLENGESDEQCEKSHGIGWGIGIGVEARRLMGHRLPNGQIMGATAGLLQPRQPAFWRVGRRDDLSNDRRRSARTNRPAALASRKAIRLS